MKSLQSSWVKWLYDDCIHRWEIMPLYQVNKNFSLYFKFHLNLSFKKSFIKKLLLLLPASVNLLEPKSFRIYSLMYYLSFFDLSNTLKLRVLQYYKIISNEGINFLLQLFENEGIISWINLNDKYELTNDIFSGLN